MKMFLCGVLSLGVWLTGMVPVQARSHCRPPAHGHGHHRHHPHRDVFFSLDLRPRSYRPVVGSVARPHVVADVQRALNRRGYAAGAVDGVLGSQTRHAISAYQADHGLSRTGTVNTPLLRSLGFL